MSRSGRVFRQMFQASILALFLAVLIREDYPAKIFQAVTGLPTPVTETAHYREMQQTHARWLEQVAAGTPIQIGFAGDSIIAGWLTSAQFRASINLGVGRDTIDGLLARIAPETVQQVPIWYLDIGINDVLRGHDPAALPDQVAQLAKRFGPAKLLVWQEALPVVRPDWTEAQESHRTELNTLIHAACTQLPRCTVLPAPKSYSAHQSDWTSDGLHPNAKGYQALAQQLQKALNKVQPNC